MDRGYGGQGGVGGHMVGYMRKKMIRDRKSRVCCLLGWSMVAETLVVSEVVEPGLRLVKKKFISFVICIEILLIFVQNLNTHDNEKRISIYQ
jgi:hypothetical protein